MTKIALCDDNQQFMKNISELIHDCMKQEKIKVKLYLFNSGTNLINAYKQTGNLFDIVLLDIDMPDMNGMETAKYIRQYDDQCMLIFLTSMDDQVYKVFEFNTFRFIRKKYYEKELHAALLDAIKCLEEKEIKYEFKTKDEVVKLSTNEILYFEMVNRNVEMHTLHRPYTLTMSIFKEISDKFSDKGFVSVYKGALVNLRYIKSVKKMQIELDNGEVLGVSRQRMADVKRAFFEFERGEF